jgi:hypothetical protein
MDSGFLRVGYESLAVMFMQKRVYYLPLVGIIIPGNIYSL